MCRSLHRLSNDALDVGRVNDEFLIGQFAVDIARDHRRCDVQKENQIRRWTLVWHGSIRWHACSDQIRCFVGVEDELSAVLVVESNVKEMLVGIVSNLECQRGHVDDVGKDELIGVSLINVRLVDEGQRVS